jgi:hypothetical protein
MAEDCHAAKDQGRRLEMTITVESLAMTGRVSPSQRVPSGGMGESYERFFLPGCGFS